MITIEVDIERCCGAGACVLRAPDVFDQNDNDGTVIVLDEHPPDDQADAVDLAAQMCPASVITVRRHQAVDT